MKFYFTQELGPKRKMTPEGFLICEDVPIARVGDQLYGEGEVPVPAVSGRISIERREEDVFRPETIASGQGKPIVNDHPMDESALEDGWDVNPTNWTQHARGVVLNPRRGEGTQRDYLIADFLVTDASAIAAVLSGKVEVSCGYNADYETLSEGRGRQHNILLNHVALVQQGRCGASCSIGDEDTMTRTRDKSKGKGNPTLDKAYAALDRIRRGFKSKTLDEKLLAEGMGEVEEGLNAAEDAAGEGEGGAKVGEHHVHVHLPESGGGKGTGEVTDEDPAATTGAGAGGEMGDRLARLEALFTKFAPILEKLAGGGSDPAAKPSAADEEGMVEGEAELDDPDAAATGDSELFNGEVSMEDPHPAATGDDEMPEALKKNMKTGDQALGFAVKDSTGKIVLRKFPTKTADGTNVRARDSAHLGEMFNEVLARAEVLSPGIKVPTYDAKMPATKTLDAVCGLRRRSLLRAWSTEDGKEMIEPIFSGDLKAKLPGMTCDAVRLVFNGAAELARVANNTNNTARSGVVRTADNSKPAIRSTADINARNREMYSQPKNG